MTLLETRIEFTRCLGDLLKFSETSKGYDLIVDEVKRSQFTSTWNATHCRVEVGGKRCEKIKPDPVHEGHTFKPIGIARSVHNHSLAADLYIIVDRQISNDPNEYAILGTYWKTLHPLARWGGDFKGFPDLGHFSFTYEGRS